MTTDAAYNFYSDWNNDGDFSDANEDVSDWVLASDVSVEYGRDSARSLSAIAAGSVDLELDNSDGRFSPDNSSSPLFGNLVPGRAVKIETVHLSTTRTLFRGYIDEFELQPDPHEGKCKITVLDMLNKLSAATIATEVYPSIQTGGAVNVLLDKIGWPTADRDIDSGATTLRWWFAQDDDALVVMQSLIEAEGPPAVAYVDGATFVYRDRHHRHIETPSTAVQATFRSGGTEPTFCTPMEYEIGWKDIANHIVVPVEEKGPDFYSDVFSSESIITLTAGESRVIEIDQSDGFVDLLTPVAGQDYTLVSGTATFGISNTSGGRAKLEINCQTACVIAGLRVRGRQLTVRNTVSVEHNDTGSQSEHGIRSLQDAEIDINANQHDAWAIANIIIAQRAQRRPVVSITVNNGNDTRYTQILTRKISDRIHITELNQTHVDHDHFIERIQHSVASAGKDHRVQYSCERAPDTLSDPDPPIFFTFGSASAGLSEGAFANDGVSYTETIMILDDATTGALGTGGLGW